MHFSRYRFRKSLHRKLARMVISMARKRTQSSQRRDIKNDTTTMLLILTHNRNRTRGYARSPEEQRLYFLMCFLFRCGFGVAGEGVAGIVNYDIKMVVLSEVLRGGGECSVDGTG